MTKSNSLVSALALSAALGLALSACSSDGTTRISSVGTQGPAGPAGPAGAQGEQGPQGEPGRTAPQDATGSEVDETSLNDAGMLAVGGLIGPNGVAGTGLLADTGNPDSMSQFQSELFRESGEEVVDFSVFLASIVDETELAGNPLTGAVIGTVENAGMTLVQNAEGDVYLVDGLLASPGELVNLTIGEAELLGIDGTGALIAVSTLSSETEMGGLVTLGVASGGDLANVDAGGLLDSLSSALNIDPIDLGSALAGLVPEDQSLITISENSSLGVTIIDDQLIDTDLDMVQTMSDTADAAEGMIDSGDAAPGGALEPILAGAGGDNVAGIVDPVLSSLGGGDSLGGGALDPVIDSVLGPVGGDTQEVDMNESGGSDLIGDTLDTVTGEDGLLGGLLGGGDE